MTDRLSMLVLHAGALGDCVLTLWLIHALRSAWPIRRASLAARSGIAPWAVGRGDVDEAFSLDHPAIVRGLFAGDDAAESHAFFGQFDVILSLLGGPTSPVAHRLDRLAPNRAIHLDSRPQSPDDVCAHHVVDQWIDRIHTQCEQRAVTSDWRTPIDRIESCLESGTTRLRDARAIERLRRKAGGGTSPIVICHPGSGGERKCLPLECWTQLLMRLRAVGLAPVWMLGPDELDRAGGAIPSALANTAPVLFDEVVDRAADWITGADVYVGYDAGMTHLAAMIGGPTFAIFGPTDPRVWRPLGPQCHVVPFPDEVVYEPWLQALAFDVRRAAGEPGDSSPD